MATREHRLADFQHHVAPPDDEKVELLCEDKSGTYRLPFLCVHADGGWINAETGERIGAHVVGWRIRPENRR
jgi:hypothetical protein